MAGAHIETKRITVADASVFDAVAEGVFDEPVRPDRIAAYLADRQNLMILALADGVVVGQIAAVIHRHPDKKTELYIDEVGVAPAFQRQGIARRLLDEMCVLGTSLGCEEAWVGTEEDNVAAKALYAGRRVEPKPFLMYLFDL